MYLVHSTSEIHLTLPFSKQLSVGQTDLVLTKKDLLLPRSISFWEAPKSLPFSQKCGNKSKLPESYHLR